MIPDEIDWVHCDDQLIIATKPSGLLSVPGRGPERQDCVWHRLKHHFPECLVVHRLDMGTSGLMVFARDPVSHAQLSHQFASRQVKKRYVARVSGTPNPPAGTIDLPLICDWPNRPRQIVCFTHGKNALTHYHIDTQVPSPEGTSRIALEPVTGRSHQLRVHLQSIGHPIIGDELYHPDYLSLDLSQPAKQRLLLHAEELQLRHPLTQQWLTFYSAAPF